jgi:hypothetical protein
MNTFCISGTVSGIALNRTEIQLQHIVGDRVCQSLFRLSEKLSDDFVVGDKVVLEGVLSDEGMGVPTYAVPIVTGVVAYV